MVEIIARQKIHQYLTVQRIRPGAIVDCSNKKKGGSFALSC